MPEEVRVPKQKRSMEKKEAIKKAALELFSTQGYHNTSTNEIAKKAGVSIGTLYSYYPDKRAIYDELVGDLYRTTMEEVKFTEFPRDSSVRRQVRGYVSLVLHNHEYMTAFQKELSALSMLYEDLRVLEQKYRMQVGGSLLQMFQENKEILRVKDLRTAAFLIQNSLEAVVHEVTFFENDMDKEQVIDELTEMICRYCIRDEYLQ